MIRRTLLKYAGIVSGAAALALYGGPGEAADPAPVTVLVTYHSVTGNTEKMAQGVAEGAKAVSGTSVVLKRIGEVAANDLSSSDAVIVGSPVYFANMSGEVKTFLDNWSLKFGLFQDRKMRNKVGAAFATGLAVSGGKEFTILGILAAMLNNQMVVLSGGGGFGATPPLVPTRRVSMTRSLQPPATSASAWPKSPLLSNGDPASNAGAAIQELRSRRVWPLAMNASCTEPKPSNPAFEADALTRAAQRERWALVGAGYETTEDAQRSTDGFET